MERSAIEVFFRKRKNHGGEEVLVFSVDFFWGRGVATCFSFGRVWVSLESGI